MNRLWVRLTLSFILVTLVGAFAVVALTDWSTGAQFRQFLARQDMLAQGGLLDDLAAYYQRNGSWNGVSAVIPAGGAMGRGRGQMRGRPSVMIADTNAQIVYDERNARADSALTKDERANALPIQVDGKTVGYLATSAPIDALAPTEQNFLDELRQTLVVAGLVAGGLGILIGLAISRALAAPLAELADAARAFAGRDWKRRVTVRGADEIATVAREFNAMASALERAEIQRQNLMADIAHELRTPLAVLQGNLSAMLDEVYPLERKEIATLYDETRLLSRLVDDLRELALAEAGQLTLNVQEIELREVLANAVKNLSAAADAQNVQLKLDAPAPALRVRADPDRLAQVLRNLLTNALRHTPSGGVISVRCSVDSGQWSVGSGRRLALSVAEGSAVGGQPSVRVSVSDTGEGIAAEDLARVFDRFYRADKSRARVSGGTGLGLAIAKSLVVAMGGEIGVESALGRGSTFWFTLRLA